MVHDVRMGICIRAGEIGFVTSPDRDAENDHRVAQTWNAVVETPADEKSTDRTAVGLVHTVEEYSPLVVVGTEAGLARAQHAEREEEVASMAACSRA